MDRNYIIGDSIFRQLLFSESNGCVELIFEVKHIYFTGRENLAPRRGLSRTKDHRMGDVITGGLFFGRYTGFEI